MSDGVARCKRVRGFERFFTRYITWLLRRSFATIWLAKDAAPLPAGGYVAAANHSSWWDGFAGGFLHKRDDASRDFAVLMSEREFRRFPFFGWLGVLPIDTSTPRSVYRAVLEAAEEARAGAGVWIFPQGEILRGKSWTRFGGGFARVALRADVPAVPVAIRYAMRDRQRPELFISIGSPVRERSYAALKHEMERAVLELLARIDESIAADTVGERFVPVLSEHPGIDARISAVLTFFLRR